MKTALFLFASLVPCLVARGESPSSIPNPRQTNHSSIYDGGHVLNNAEKHRIDDAINALEKKTKAQMMVVTIETLDGMSIEKWSTTVFNRLGIGRKGINDGALFVFVMRERKSRLEVGTGIRNRLTDKRAQAILVNQIAPAFRAGHYGQGILDGVNVAAQYIDSPSHSFKPRSSTKASNLQHSHS